MKWFLVLLFWNPEAAEFQVGDGWAPLEQPSFERCENRKDYVKQYLPGYVDGMEHIVACVLAENMQDAADTAKAENSLR